MTNLVHLRLTLDVSYDPHSASVDALRANLRNVVQHATQEGMFTMGTDAEVETFSFNTERTFRHSTPDQQRAPVEVAPKVGRDPQTQARDEGWDLFDVDGKYDLQRNDENTTFESDYAALAFVAQRAAAGSAYHAEALSKIGQPVESSETLWASSHRDASRHRVGGTNWTHVQKVFEANLAENAPVATPYEPHWPATRQRHIRKVLESLELDMTVAAILHSGVSIRGLVSESEDPDNVLVLVEAFEHDAETKGFYETAIHVDDIAVIRITRYTKRREV